MQRPKKILVFTATYNEVENIKSFVYSVKKQPLDPDLLIIDLKLKIKNSLKLFKANKKFNI